MEKKFNFIIADNTDPDTSIMKDITICSSNLNFFHFNWIFIFSFLISEKSGDRQKKSWVGFPGITLGDSRPNYDS